jgi:hypothetical protein
MMMMMAVIAAALLVQDRVCSRQFCTPGRLLSPFIVRRGDIGAVLCRSIWLKKDFILNTAGLSPRPAPAIKGGTKTKQNVLVFENSTDLAQLTPNQKPFRGCWGCLVSESESSKSHLHLGPQHIGVIDTRRWK